MILNNNQLKEIKGGGISATLINAIVKGLDLLINLGKSLGTTIRHITSGTTCKVE